MFDSSGTNEYSRKGVLMGNWVEDHQGVEWVDRRGVDKVVPFSGLSESRSRFIPPSSMPTRRQVADEAESGGVSASGGMPRHLLFAHGVKSHDPRDGEEERFCSMAQLSFGVARDRGVRVEDALSEKPKPEVRRAMRKETARSALITSLERRRRTGAAPSDARIGRRPATDPYASVSKLSTAHAAEATRRASATLRDMGSTVQVNGVTVVAPKLAPEKKPAFSATFSKLRD